MHFTAETSANGVLERDFTVGDVPGVLWSPAAGGEHLPLVLMGHGGGTHKKAPAMTGRAERIVMRLWVRRRRSRRARARRPAAHRP